MTDNDSLTAASLFNLKGWVAVVTGGGTGLGLMASQALAANGARVYIGGRRLEKLKAAEMDDSKSGGAIIGVEMDVTSKESIQKTVKTIAEKEKYLNILVNNAGTANVEYPNGDFPSGTPAEISTILMDLMNFDHWADPYALNVASIYFTSAAFLPLLCAARDNGFGEAGNILNISSVSGITKESQGGGFTYTASKRAAIGLTEGLASDFKRPGVEVRVNTIAPGYFPSELTQLDRHDGKGKDFWRDRDLYGIPMGRPGNARDYAQAVLSLAVNQYCTGSTLVVDGGFLLNHS